MSAVDERIVEMQFNNRQFEKGVAESTKSLETLKKSLDFSSTSKSLSALESSAKGLRFSDLSNALSIVADRFSFIGIVGDQVIRQLTNRLLGLVGVVSRFIKSMTVEPILSGWQAYADQTTAIQQIISNGYNMDDAEKVVEKLAWYTDETSYNMSDMITNLGKFTSAGIPLAEAEQAIIGLSNAAGSAGVGVTGASHAMEGFSKAIANNKMTSQNWQWIRTARMDTDEFKTALIEAGLEAGTLKKVGDTIRTTKGNAEVTAANLEASLNKGWLDSKTMLAALTRYGAFTNDLYRQIEESGGELTASEILASTAANMDDISEKGFRMSQEAKTFKEAVEAGMTAVSSGWATTFKLLFGNYEEAKVLWTDLANELYDVFAEAGNRRNELLEEWHTKGGYEKFIETIRNTWEGLKNIIEPIKEAMAEIFPPMTVDRLMAITDKVRALSIQFKNAFEFITPIKEKLETSRAVISDIDDRLKVLEHNQKVAENLEKLHNIIKIITAPLAIIKNLIGAIKRTLEPLLGLTEGVGEKIANAASSLGSWLDTLRQTIEDNDSFYNFFQKIIGFFNDLITASDGSKLSIGGFIEKIKGFKPLELIMKGIAAAKEKIEANGGLGKILGDAAASGWDFIKTWANKIIGKIQEVWPAVVDAIKAMDFNKAFGLLGFVGAGRVIYNLVWTISEAFRSFKGLFTGGFNLSDMFSQVTDTLWELQSKLESQTIRNVAISIAILAGSMLLISTIPENKLVSIISAIALLMGVIVLAMQSINGMGIMGPNKSILGQLGDILLGKGPGRQLSNMFAINKLLRGLAISILMLAASVWIISKAGDGAIVGMIAIIVMMTALVETVKRLDKNIIGAEAAAKVMKKLAMSIVILSAAVRILAILKPDQIIMGVLAVGALIFALGAFITNVAPALEKFGGKGLSSVLSISVALFVLSSVAQRFGKMKWGELAKAGAAIGALLLALGLFTRFSTGTYNPSASAASVLIISAAMLVMAGVVKILSNLSWEQLGKGIATMVVSLAAFAGAIWLMREALGESGGGMAIAAILALAFAMQMLIPVFLAFSIISWADLFKPIAAVAAALVVFGAAAFFLEPFLPELFTLAVIVATIGLAMTLAGVGLLAFNTALTLFVAEAAVNVIAIVGFIKALIYGIDESIPLIIGMLGHLLGAIIIGLGEMAVPIVNSIVDMLIRVLDALGRAIGALAAPISIFIISLIDSVAESIRVLGKEGLWPAIENLFSSIVELILRLIGDLADKIIPGLGKKVKASLDKLADDFETVYSHDVNVEVDVDTNLPEDTEVEVDLSVNKDAPLIPLEEWGVEGSEGGAAYGEAFLGAMSGAVEGSGIDLFNMEDLMNPGGTEESGESAFNVFSGSYLGSFSESAGEAQTAGGELAKATLEGMDPYLEEFSAKGIEMVTEYTNGLMEDETPITIAGMEIGAASIYGAQSQLSGMTLQGRNFVLGFATGMNGLRQTLYQTAYNIGYLALSAVKEAINSNSPSKETMRLGSYFVDGFSLGINKNKNQAYLASEEMANESLDAMNLVLNEISDRLNSEMDSNPRIIPVLDMTNVRAGMAEIDSIFANRPWVPVNMNGINPPSKFSSIMPRNSTENQNGSPTTINLNVTTQELSNSTVDYLVRRVNRVLGGKV